MTDFPVKIGGECYAKRSYLNKFDGYSIFAMYANLNLAHLSFISTLLFFSLTFAALTCLVTLSTAYEVYVMQNNANRKTINESKTLKRLSSILLVFSLLRNAKRLTHSSHRIECVDTIIMIFVIWSVIVSSYMSAFTIRAIGLKRPFNGLPLDLLKSKIYFWVHTLLPWDAASTA